MQTIGMSAASSGMGGILAHRLDSESDRGGGKQEAGGWLDTPVIISLGLYQAACRRASVPVEAFAINQRRVGMRHVKWAVVVLGLVAMAFGLDAVQGQPLSGEYKIGVLEPLTGNLAVQGKLHLEGYEIMRDLINERFGGVMGKKLVFVTGDAVDPTVAASEATRLATREGVKIITGTFASTLCGAASEAASRQNVIYWESSCVDPRLTRRNLKNVFRTEIDGTGFGWYNVEFIAKHLAHRLGKKTSELRIAYLSEDSSYGQSVTESARQRAKTEFGMQEVAPPEYYTFTTNDLTPIILKLKNANPDILHHIARNQDAILFWRQAREQGFQVKAVVHAGETGQNSNARVQHYMLQWQNGSLVTVWPEEFTTNRAKWIPLGPWYQRK